MSNNVPIIIPAYVGFNPRLDEKVNDQIWANVDKITGFELVGFNGPATQQTEIKVCYDRTNLYVLFECFEDNMDAIITKFTDDHSPVWQDDSVEIFISPYSVAGPTKSHQFVVNAAGAKAYLRPDWVRENENWRAAAVRLGDRWIAEISIPFSILKPFGRNEDCWRVNFCRNEHPHYEMSSWSGVPQWYATYSRFGKMIPPAAPFTFTTFRGLLVPINNGDPASTGLEAVEGPVKELCSTCCIIPEPQEIHNRMSKAPFRITPNTSIVINDDATEVDLWTIDEINAAIIDLGGKPLKTVPAAAVSREPSSLNDIIVIGENAQNSLIRTICEREEVRMPRSRFGTGTHVVDILPNRLVVVGSSVVDTYYGAQTLKQLLKKDEAGGIYAQSVSIRDFPRFQFRCVHLLSSADALPYISKLIDRVLAPLKINNIILQTDLIAWKEHPEIAAEENAMPCEDVKKLLEIARKHHITVTPLVQSPGHLEWAYRNRSHLNIAEDPNDPYCYCMSNPESYEFIFSIIDEAIELFDHPALFHAGRDEFDMIGRMPVDEACKTVGKERLYIDDTIKIYEHLKSRGSRMVMWGDVLTKAGFREMIDLLPKDILINDWRYSPSETYPSIDFYQSKGFTIIASTWYDPRNISTFCSYAAKRGIMGMSQTTWTGWQSEEQTLKNHPNQVYAYVLSAAWAWNPVRPSIDDLPFRPEAVYRKMMKIPSPSEGAEFFTINIDNYCNISRIDSGRTPGWLGIGRGNDLRGLPDGIVKIGDVPYKIIPAKLNNPSVVMLGGDGVTLQFPHCVDGIVVNSKIKALDFLDGCAFSADNEAEVGNYIIHYVDGKTETASLYYQKNVYAWDDQSSGMSYGFAWRGKAQDGRSVGVCSSRWQNPRPDVEIATIDFVETGTEASPFLLAITAEK